MLNKTMNKLDYAEVADRGKTVRVPSVVVDGRKVTITGGIVKVAGIFDEEFVEG